VSDLRVKRAYRAARRSDGQRVLVDRIWPRGLAKDRLRLDAWEKELAPSAELRAWFGHDPKKWEEFCKRYARELDARTEEVEALRQRLRDGPVTLVYGAKDEQHNNAVALKAYIERQEEQG
jgi:uncharacterized protein YeaO (DUF488 family)